MLELFGIAVVGFVAVLVVGVTLKLLGVVLSLALLPLKLLFAFGGVLIAGAAMILVLPVTLFAIVAALGGALFLGLGFLRAVF